MGKRIYKIGAIVAVTLLLGSVFVMVATSADAATTPSYTVGKNTSGKTYVLSSSGKTVYTSSDSQAAIQYAIDRTASGGLVALKSATYTLDSPLVMKSGVTLSGSGSSTIINNGGIRITDVSNVNLKLFSLKGSANVEITAKNADVSNIVLTDISASKVSGVSSVYTVDAQKHTVSNLKLIRVTTVDADTYGFVFKGSGSGTSLITGVTIDSCKATGSGVNARTNDWVVGFALAVNVDVANIYVKNSESSYNWENGFYFRSDVSKTNVVLENCIANYNGQKPAFAEGYGYLVDSSIILKNCNGTGNKGGLVNQDVPPTPVQGSSAMSLTMTSSSVTVNNAIHADGQLIGTSTSGTSSIEGATVKLSVTLPDGTVVNPSQGATVTTGTGTSAGKFSVDFTPTVAGTYKITATFDGSSAYGASSKTVTFQATAAPASDPQPTNVVYTVYSNGQVKDSTGKVVYSGDVATAINTALGMTKSGQTVLLAPGTFTISSSVRVPNGVTLSGSGKTSTIVYGSVKCYIGATGAPTDVTIKDMKLTGQCQIRLNINAGSTARNILFEDIIVEEITSSNSAAFQIYGNGVTATADGVKFIRCEAINVDTYGFLLIGNKDDYPLMTNFYFEGCKAIGCGRYAYNNEWAVGFDLAERVRISNMKLVNCEASYNLESGFHIECDITPTNIVLENCVANYNGQKPDALYGSGYMLGQKKYFDGGQIRLIDCTAVGNSVFAIRFCGGTTAPLP